MSAPTELPVSLAERADLPAIVDISNWAAAHTTANFATEPESAQSWLATWEQTAAQHPWLVVREAGQVIGFARSGPHRARGAYAWSADVSVYVHPDHHRRGVGSALYRVFLPTLRAQGYVTAIAGITSPNPGSERLHASFGFERCATFARIGWKFDAWHDVGYWSLALRPLADDTPPRRIRPVAAVWPPARSSTSPPA
jgi:phosphinothricin acetyltransferase